MTRARAIIPALAAALLLPAALPAAGCAKARERWRARFDPPEPEPTRLIEPTDPGLSAAEEGLEIIVWTADDAGERVGLALRDFAEAPPPVEPEVARRWREAGLRLIAVPPHELDALLVRCPPVSPIQRHRFGQFPRWTPLVRGPRTPPGLTDPDGLPLQAGRPRLIARSWVEPDLSLGRHRRVVRTELAVQIEGERRTGLYTDPPAERSIADAGPVLAALRAAHLGVGDEALVIVAESPLVDWSELPEPPPPGAETPADGADAAPEDAKPEQAPPRSLGEWMLSSPRIPAERGRASIPPRKVFVVLLPRLRPDPPGEAGEP